MAFAIASAPAAAASEVLLHVVADGVQCIPPAHTSAVVAKAGVTATAKVASAGHTCPRNTIAVVAAPLDIVLTTGLLLQPQVQATRKHLPKQCSTL